MNCKVGDDVYFVIYQLVRYKALKGTCIQDKYTGFKSIQYTDKVYLIEPKRIFASKIEAIKRANLLNSNGRKKHVKLL